MENKGFRISKIRKRDGRIVEFAPEKIVNAIYKAAQGVAVKEGKTTDKKEAEELANKAITILEYHFTEKELPTVEEAQDIVEKVLIKSGHAKTAKAYILYRQQHAKLREAKDMMVDVGHTIKSYIHQEDWKVKENSNEDYSFSGLLLYAAGKVIGNYALNEIYTPDIKEAHVKGYFHIHDLSNAVIGYSFYRNEGVVVREKNSGKILCLSLEQLYDLLDKPVEKENGFEMKYPIDYEILDEGKWTDVVRVLRHKTTKPLLSFNTFNGHNLIVTNDHHFITLQDEKKVFVCEKCKGSRIVKNRTNKVGKDHFKCKDCGYKFGLEKEKTDINKRKEMLAQEIKLTNYAITPSFSINPIGDKTLLTSEEGWFIGLFAAEGYFWSNYLMFEFKEGCEEINKLRGYLKDKKIKYNSFSRAVEEKEIDINSESLQLEQKSILKQDIKTSIGIHLKSLSSELQTLFSEVRPYAINKNLPISFLNYPQEVIGGMVSGVIDGDGVVRNDDPWVSRVTIRLTSKTLLSQIQYWLSALKLNSSLSTIDSYGEREYKGKIIKSKNQLHCLTIYIPDEMAHLFKESLKIRGDFKYSDFSIHKEFSHLRKIEAIKNDSEYVYDITTSSNTFLCNGMLVHNCAGWSLKKLLETGFGGIPNKVDCKPAKHLNTVIHQMVNYIGCLQMEFAGAQAFSSVDTLLAPFVKADTLSFKETKQCIQQLVFSLNIPSRWGSQYPFSNLTFDWVVPADMKDDKAIVGGKKQEFTYGDCQEEMDIINKAFLEVMFEGDAKGRVFTFPIPTYNLTKNFDWDSENAKLLFEVTAKYGLPYFQNYVGSELDPRSIRSMCCRLNLDQNQLIKRPGGMWGPGDATGSVGVVTLNLNRLGYEARSKEEFFERLSYYMTLAKNSLEIKREMVERNLKNGLMPFTKIYLGTFRNHFSTIGLCGMNECCLNFLGKDISSKEGTEFTIETLKFMRGRLVEFQEETGNLYNLEATPAESTSYRLARLDKKMYPDIVTAGDKEPYLTNSTQLPVDKTDDVIEALEHQNKIQPLYTGGTIFHTFMGERLSSGESCKELVKKIAYNTHLPYFSITPTFSICPDHGYIIGEVPKCPQCGIETEVYSRIVGYYRPIRQWNNGKKEEFKDRLEYSEGKALGRKIELKVVAEEDGTSAVESEEFISNDNSIIRRFRIFSLPNCDKCLAAKEYLGGKVDGETVDLGSDEGLKEFREVYKKLKNKIQRNKDGSLPIPTILLYDEDDNLVTVAHHVDQVKQIV